MSPKEKQAIIDKAFELGFKQNESAYFFKIDKDRELWIHVYASSIAIYITDTYEVIQLRLIVNEMQLENLFNAITK